MRTRAIVLCLAALAAPCYGGSPHGGAAPEVHLSFDDADGGTHFNYSITHPELVRSAWIEVVDRPLVIAHKAVAVQPNGELIWDWNQGLINFFEQPDDNLVLSIWDPNGETLTCDVNTVMTAQPGGVVSSTTVGAREKLGPYPQLNPSFVRVAPGSDAVTLGVTGSDLSPLTKLHIQPSKGAQCGNDSVHAQVLNFSHARITVAASCLLRPGILAVSADDRGENYSLENEVLFHVAGRRSPVLRSVSPATLPEDLLQSRLALVLRGHGFTESSTVYAGAGSYMTDQLELQTEYVSPTELRVTVHPDTDESTVSDRVSPGDKLHIWVKGNEEKYELSELKDIALRPVAGKLKFQPIRDIDFRRGHKKAPIVTTVSPFPIKLMNSRSPKELKVTIHGENFVPEDKVRFAFGNQADNDQETRTEYVSPNMLQAWLPRQLFRKHQISYRLVVETTTGHRYMRQVDVKDDE